MFKFKHEPTLRFYLYIKHKRIKVSCYVVGTECEVYEDGRNGTSFSFSTFIRMIGHK